MTRPPELWYLDPPDRTDPHTPLRPTPPLNELQALMEAPPGHEPDNSLHHLQPIRERIAAALETLPERQRTIFDALIVERRTQDELAAELGIARSTIQRERDRAILALRAALSDLNYD